MTTIRADDNWLQRRYFAWAEPHYERMPPRLRAEVERVDRWLYSRRAAGLWAGLAGAVVGSSIGLHALGLPLGLAVVVSLGVATGLPMVVLGAWLQPERFASGKGIRIAAVLAGVACLGAATSFFGLRLIRRGSVDPAPLAIDIRAFLVDVAPILVLGAAVLVAVLQVTAFARRRLLRAELERATLVGERDVAARQAAEAQLRLLQGQIRPHFIFNTLASLQHWVDTGDPRAGPLLRSLTGLLRTTTESLATPLAPLSAECDAAGHYLAIMRARLGDRLTYRIEVAAEVGAVELPAGLVLTLVENAIEHGIESMLAGGTVAVTARREGDAVVLEVDDDGAGLAAAAASGSRSGSAPPRGIGLGNSRERLRHRYGAAASLELLPAASGKGARARVRIVEGGR